MPRGKQAALPARPRAPQDTLSPLPIWPTMNSVVRPTRSGRFVQPQRPTCETRRGGRSVNGSARIFRTRFVSSCSTTSAFETGSSGRSSTAEAPSDCSRLPNQSFDLTRLGARATLDNAPDVSSRPRSDRKSTGKPMVFFMRLKNPMYVVGLVVAVVLGLYLAGCGGGDTEPTSSSETASEAAADSEDPTGVTPAEDASLEFDDIPEITGYEVTEQDQRGNELYVNLRSDATDEQAMEDFTDWAASDGWTALDVEWPNVDLVFEKPDRVYPLKISVFPQVSSGGVEVMVIMPAVGDKLGSW